MAGAYVVATQLQLRAQLALSVSRRRLYTGPRDDSHYSTITVTWPSRRLIERFLGTNELSGAGDHSYPSTSLDRR